MNLENDVIRRKLAGRYLDGDTSPSEEAMFARYFANHSPDEGEKELAMLLSLHPVRSDLEYEEICTSASGRAMNKVLKWLIPAAAAAIIAAAVMLPAERHGHEPMDTTLIAEGIDRLLDIGFTAIESVSAVPDADGAILRATLKDGSSCMYKMSCDGEGNIISLTAMQ